MVFAYGLGLIYYGLIYSLADSNNSSDSYDWVSTTFLNTIFGFGGLLEGIECTILVFIAGDKASRSDFPKVKRLTYLVLDILLVICFALGYFILRVNGPEK
ncbi:MAG: hypothetical protein K0U17_01980, partial [Betaproteobacteria bacterium]|nr:hypothetical protein [Betaproteobacteria bacterium]